MAGESNLAFLYQEQTADVETSRFNTTTTISGRSGRLVSRSSTRSRLARRARVTPPR
jgi:hypothetical protein